MSPAISQISYLVASVCFIVGLRWLGSPATAVKGNRLSSIGMLIAIVVTLLDRSIISYQVIIAGLVVGGGLGLWMAKTVKMTSMPQMVALLNGLGGGASLLVGGAEFLKSELIGQHLPLNTSIAMQATLLVGSVTLTGSLIAWAKLQEVMTGRAITFPGQKALNALLFLSVVVLAVYARCLYPGVAGGDAGELVSFVFASGRRHA